jgi:hypothetical protein
MHQQPPKTPLLRSANAANAGHVDSSRALTVYAVSVTKPNVAHLVRPRAKPSAPAEDERWLRERAIA